MEDYLEWAQRIINRAFFGTDDSSLVERLGVRIKIITSTYDNIKVTTPEDIHVAETLLQKEIC